MKGPLAVVAVLMGAQFACAQGAARPQAPNDEERAILFALRQAIQTGVPATRSELCVGLGSELSLQEKQIVRALNEYGANVHPNDWCNRGPRGVAISVRSPVIQKVAHTYEIEIEVGDLDPIRLNGAHFATLLGRGVYVVKCASDSSPELVSYHETCCSAGAISR